MWRFDALQCHKKGDKSQTQSGEENVGGRDDDDDELDINSDEEYWEGALEMPAPLRIKVHENVLKLLIFSHHPFFPLATTELPATPPMLICTPSSAARLCRHGLTAGTDPDVVAVVWVCRRVPRGAARGKDRLVRVELFRRAPGRAHAREPGRSA
jgi:hypothetical protein